MSRTKLLGSIAAVAMLLLVTSAAAYRQFVLRAEAASRLLEEGRTALAAGEFDKAIERCGAALAKTFHNETKAQAYALRSKAEIGSGRFDEAVADSTSALRLKPAFADAYLQRALAHQKKGETEKALSDFNEAARPAVTNPQAYYERARILLDAGEAEKAAADFAEAIRRGANDVGVYILHARACQASNDPDAAIASLDLAMQKEPANQEARELRGDLYYKKNDIAKAMDDFAELRTSKGESWATQAAPRTAPPPLSEIADLMRQVTAEFENGHLDAAIERCNALLSLDLPLPVASIFCQNRGNVYSAKGEPEKALRDYEQAIRFNPANAGAYLNRGLIYAQRNDHETAIKDYNEALRFQPQMYKAFFNRALSYRAQDDWPAAERDLQETIRLNPKFAPAYVTRALISARRGRLDKALAEYELAKRAVSEAHVGIGLFASAKTSLRALGRKFRKSPRAHGCEGIAA